MKGYHMQVKTGKISIDHNGIHEWLSEWHYLNEISRQDTLFYHIEPTGNTIFGVTLSPDSGLI